MLRKKIIILLCITGALALPNASFGIECPGMAGPGSNVYVDGHSGESEYYCGEITASECVELGGAPSTSWDATSTTINWVAAGYANACADEDGGDLGSLTYSKTTGWTWTLSVSGSFKWKPGVIIGPELNITVTGSVSYNTQETNSITTNFSTPGCKRKRREAIYYNKTGTVEMPVEVYAEYEYEKDENAHADCQFDSGTYYGNGSQLNGDPFSTDTISTTTVQRIYEFISTDVTVTCPKRTECPCQKLTDAGPEPPMNN